MSSSSQLNNVATVAEDFLARIRRGENPSIEEYTSRHPDLAAEIREFFPALVLVEQLKPASRAIASADDCDSGAGQEAIPARLGDFRLVREIGRGGMGLVFEAFQESLGRPVALKVLRAPRLTNAVQNKRFAREARAVARLHHTNIVPVFGVGEHEGVQFYAMQYIQGRGLDMVLAELRRIRADGRVASSANREVRIDSPTVKQFDRTSPNRELAERGLAFDEAARRLLSGQLADQPNSELQDASAAIAMLASSARSDAGRPGPTAYWHGIARIGVQVGEALQYAHEQGVLHRDIKPSNLLLDNRGTVWLTDFGLAKADDQDDLTKSGDVLGTLRYMAPEQLEGRADARSDVYALGMTLYELLALRPAFEQCARHQLVKQVMTETPAPLRRIDHHIPADLATIVHKAIEREPSHRYQTAGELADDLKRYLNDLPIRARRISLPARFGRWARRNPAWALLLLVLVLLAGVSPPVAVYFGRLTQQAEAARLQAQRREYGAERSQAMAWRVSGQAGQQFSTMRALTAAVELHHELDLDAADLNAMRDEAIAALALPDLLPERQWTVPAPRILSLIHFDPALEHYTRWSSDPVEHKGLSVRRVVDDSEVARLKINGNSQKVRFSPDGRLIRLTHVIDESKRVEVWDWRRQKMLYRVPKQAMLLAHDFSPNSKLLAVGHEDATVTLHDLAKGTQIADFQVAAAPIAIAFHPTQPQLAVSCKDANCVQLWGLEPQRLLRTLSHPSDVLSLTWHPDGRCLAVVAGFDIHMWNLSSDAGEPFRILRGHSSVVGEMLFHPSGRLLYSHSWNESRTLVWDPFRGRQLLWCDGFLSAISQDGRRLGFRTPDQIGIWSVSAGEACIWPPAFESETPFADFCQYSPDGRLLASAGAHGIHVWCPSTWKLLAAMPRVATHSVCFDATGSSLFAAHKSTSQEAVQNGGPVRYPLQYDASGLRLGRPEVLKVPADTFAFHLALAGDHLLADLTQEPDFRPTGSAALINLASRSTRLLAGSPELRYTTVSADGRWAAAGNRYGENVTIWNAKTGAHLMDLPTEDTTLLAFSPNSRWLATASTSKLAIWDVRSWKTRLVIPRSGNFAAVAWSPDSRLLAATTGSRLQLIDAESGGTLLTLTSYDQPGYVSWLAFRPQGNQLAVCCAGDGLRVWDLRQLRLKLRRIGLDWQASLVP